MNIIEDTEATGKRCQQLFSFKGFPIGDPEFKGFCIIKAKNQEHAKNILERMLEKRGLETTWPYTIREEGEITPPNQE